MGADFRQGAGLWKGKNRAVVQPEEKSLKAKN